MPKRGGPRSHLHDSVHHGTEGALGCVLEHDAELVGTLVPTPAVKLDEVGVVQWSHDLKMQHALSERAESIGGFSL